MSLLQMQGCLFRNKDMDLPYYIQLKKKYRKNFCQLGQKKISGLPCSYFPAMHPKTNALLLATFLGWKSGNNWGEKQTRKSPEEWSLLNFISSNLFHLLNFISSNLLLFFNFISCWNLFLLQWLTSFNFLFLLE